MDCIKTTTDITQGIPREGVVHFCRGCEVITRHQNFLLTTAILAATARLGQRTTRKQGTAVFMS